MSTETKQSPDESVDGEGGREDVEWVRDEILMLEIGHP